mmetsp:Transcript_6591/g.24683  ORF Transcript_6591/g.24683 Transcript_6591/m.24683 type:complete len:107 (-) Transcript_6591:106-426(-)
MPGAKQETRRMVGTRMDENTMDAQYLESHGRGTQIDIGTRSVCLNQRVDIGDARGEGKREVSRRTSSRGIREPLKCLPPPGSLVASRLTESTDWALHRLTSRLSRD